MQNIIFTDNVLSGSGFATAVAADSLFIFSRHTNPEAIASGLEWAAETASEIQPLMRTSKEQANAKAKRVVEELKHLLWLAECLVEETT